MSIKKLDEISVSCFINRGPYLTNSFDNFFTSKNALGIPMEMELHSSIDGFYRYGYVIFYDETGIRESLPLTGNEILSIVYKNSSNSLTTSMPSIVHFNIFDMEELILNPAAYDSKRYTGKVIKFHLIECPFFLKYNDRTWKVAFGEDPGNGTDLRMYTHDIFKKHFSEHLKLNQNDPKNDIVELNISKMSTKMHFISPSWKSQKLMSYLLQYARDENGCGNVKLFTTSNNQTGKPIVNLISLNQLFKNNANKIITEFVHTTNGDIEGKLETLGANTLNQILNYKFLFYDLSSIPAGFAGGHIINYDYRSGQHFIQYDNYVESNKKKENSYFSNFGLWNNTISNEETKQFYYGPMSKDEAKNYLNNKITNQKYQLRCEIMTYIDENIYVGDKVLITFPSGVSEATREQQSFMFDEHMSDEWIVQDVIDTYKDGRGLRKMTIIKDSFFNLYGNSTGAASTNVIPKVKNVNAKG